MQRSWRPVVVLSRASAAVLRTASTTATASVLSKLGVCGQGDVQQGFAAHPIGADPYSSGHYVAPNEV